MITYMKKNVVLNFALVLFFSFAFLTPAALAQMGGNSGPANPPPTTNPGGLSGNNTSFGISFPNPLANGEDNLYEFIRLVINNVVMPIGGVIAVFYIILAGFKFVTAQGDTKQIEQARAALLYAAIGTAILLGAWVISLAIESTINQVING